jgi:hypothetical protein
MRIRDVLRTGRNENLPQTQAEDLGEEPALKKEAHGRSIIF